MIIEDKHVGSAILFALGSLAVLLHPPEAASGADIEWTGTMWALNVPGKAPKQQLTLVEAKEVIRKYRWVYVNASLKDLKEGKEEARKLASAVRRPLVLVYLSRQVFDAQRGDYSRRFQDHLGWLVEDAMATGRELLVCGRSYGVHQALRVLRRFDSPKILLIGIAPAFGWLGTSLTSNVRQYIRDVEATRCRYGMIASKDDGFTWRSGGAAYADSGQPGGYRGDNDVGRAMSRNPQNVTTVVLDGADHTPIDEYLRHGLVDGMGRVVRHFGMEKTPVGDVVSGRAIHCLRILLDGLAGRGTLAASGRGPQRITFRVEGMDGPPADVQVLVGGVLRAHYRLAERENATFTLTGRASQILLRASSGNRRGEATVQLDYDPPTFSGVAVSPAPGRPDGYVLSAEGVRDDGNWNTSDYRAILTLDGRPLPPQPGIAVTVANLAPGEHAAAMRLQDGAGRLSELKTVKFRSGSQPPSLAFVRPAANAGVQRGGRLTITIEAGDPEGIMRVSLYLDRVSNDEFDSTKLRDFPGPFGAGSAERKTCQVSANWSRGPHRLIAVAVDNSGQSTRAERPFRVD